QRLDAQIELRLHVFDSEQDSLNYLDASVRARKLRDEARSPARTEGAIYRMLSAPDPSGVLYEKTKIYGELPVKLRGACVVKGRIVGELMIVNLDWDQESLLTRIQAILAIVSTPGGSGAGDGDR